MKVEYIRRLNASHMVVEQEKEMSQWELSMLEHNEIEGVLFAKEVSENQIHKLWYDITGKQALDMLPESDRLDYELFCRLFTRLLEVTNRLEKLLLSADNLWLKPEAVFVDGREGTVSFCYYPGYQETLQKSFEELVEYLLTKVNHKDDKAVELIYRLYEQTRREGYSLSGLLQDIHISYPREDDSDEKGRTYRAKKEPLEESLPGRVLAQQKESLCDAGKKTGRKQKILGGKGNGGDKRRRTAIAKKQKRDGLEEGRTKEKEHTREKRLRGAKYDIVFWQRLVEEFKRYFGWESGGKKQGKAFGEDDKEQENMFVFSPEEKKEQQNLHPTVLLSEITQKTEGILRYEGEGEQSDLVLDTFPFVIGSDKSCNGYLQSAAVSRRHARVTKQEDLYFIEDLNSLNGTYVGGEPLNYRVRMSLQKNELVVFADKKFRFI